MKKPNAMERDYSTRHACRVCQSTDLEHIMDIAETPVGDAFGPSREQSVSLPVFPLALYSCRACGLAQLSGVVNPKLIYDDYCYTTSSSLGLDAHFENYAETLLFKLPLPANGLIVDIGSNTGSLLRSLQRRGARVLGVEPAAKLAAQATASGVETLALFFNGQVGHDLRATYGPAHIITANNVFANMDDLTDILEGVRAFLHPEGTFVIETGYLLDTIQNGVIDNIYHEHVSYFSVKPLCRLLEKHGFKMVGVERTATKGGSIRCMAKLSQAAMPDTYSVTALETLEDQLCFGTSMPLRIFAKRMQSIREEVRALVADLRAKGKRLSGYGASVGVTTLLYWLDIARDMDCLFDDNPIKHHTFSPGHGLPVLPSSEIYERRPDYIVNFAWRYTLPIVGRHERFLREGGAFIRILPEVAVCRDPGKA